MIFQRLFHLINIHGVIFFFHFISIWFSSSKIVTIYGKISNGHRLNLSCTWAWFVVNDRRMSTSWFIQFIQQVLEKKQNMNSR